MALEMGIGLTLVPIPEGTPGTDILNYTHFKIDEPCRNIICLQMKGEEQKIGWFYFVTRESNKVTCPECLEMVHS